MKQYLEIGTSIVQGQAVYAFDKLDGSCIRAEWTRKNGFYKFGSRTRLLDRAEKPLGEAIDLFMADSGDELARRFKDERWQEVIAFFEFWGPNSFAGNHMNEEHYASLFDISVHKKGILLPKDFLKLTEGIRRAKLLYHGNANQPFADSVREGRLEGMTFEGVVCKGPYVTPGVPMMFKIKSQAWFNRLKGLCGNDEEMFRRLS